MKFRIASFLVSFTILAILIYLSDVNQMVYYLTQAEPVFLMAGLMISIFMMMVRIFRWKVLLRGLNISLGVPKLFHVYMGGMLISNITPAKSGDPIRSYFLKKKTRIEFSRSLASVIVERIFDIVIVTVSSITAVFLISALIREVGNVLTISIAIYVILVCVLMYIGVNQDRLIRFLNKMSSILRFLPKARKYERKITGFSSNFNRSLMKYKKKKRTLLMTLALTLFIWLMEGSVYYFAFRSLGLEVDLIPCFLIMCIAVLIGVISSLPGGLGSFETVMVVLFTTLFSFPVAMTTAAILLGRLMGFWLYMLVGGFSLGFKI